MRPVDTPSCTADFTFVDTDAGYAAECDDQIEALPGA